MMPLDLFVRRASDAEGDPRQFSGANLVTLLLYAALGGLLFFWPFQLIQVQGWSPTAAGAAFLPFIALMFAGSRYAGALADRVGARPPLVVGPLVVAVAFLLFARAGVTAGYWTTYFPAVVVLGLGMVVAVAPLTTAVMGAVAPRRSGIASGVNNAVARTAGLLAIAVLGLVVLGAFGRAVATRLDALGPVLPPAARAALDAERTKLAAATVPAGVGPAVGAAVKQALAASFVDAFRLAMRLCAGLAAASALIAALTIRAKGATRTAR
jgi:MFS family permease